MWEFIDGVTMKQIAHNYMQQDFLHFDALRNYEHPRSLSPGERLRVGIVTADAGNTNVGRDMIGWFSHLNVSESNIEIHLFVTRKPDFGISYNYILKHCQHVHEVHTLTHEDAADYIHRQKIHILINLNGYTKFSRNEIFALHPAPLQIAFKGYPGTLGAPYMEYMIGDRVTTPVEDESHFAEKLIIMPHCYFMATYPVSFAHVVDPNYVARFVRSDRPKYGLPVDKFVFCNFNHLVKLTPRV
jgi:protein O-GlcNAc transferase